MERHIDDVYKHLHSDPQSVSSRTKFAFNIVTPEVNFFRSIFDFNYIPFLLQALRYAVCKVLKVSYGAAKFIVIFGHRERLDGDLMGPTDRKRHSRSSSSESNCILTKSSSKSRASPYKSKIGTRSSSSNERDSIRSTSRRNKEFQSRDKRHRRSSSSESNCALSKPSSKSRASPVNKKKIPIQQIQSLIGEYQMSKLIYFQ